MGFILQLNLTIKPLVSRIRRRQWLDLFFRRAMDITASVIGLLMLSPFFLLIAMLIRSDSPGPIFYRGPRLGKNGKVFGILKFRTMYARAESFTGPRLTANHDVRITPIGSWLRDTKLNELPQLWNVLVGDMSLVGPRPEDPQLALGWSEDTRQEILSVRPGITSPASIAYRDEEKILSPNDLIDDYLRRVLPTKLRLDLLYIRQRTIINDLDIIFLTLAVLIPNFHRYGIPERLFYKGPLFSFFTRFFNWFVIDWLIAFCAVGLSGFIWRLSGPIDLGGPSAALTAFIIALCFSLTNYVLRINRIAWRTARAISAFELGLSAGLATLFLLVLNLVWPFYPYILPSGLIVLSGAVAFGGFMTARYRERLITGIASRWLLMRKGSSSLGERVLVIGAGQLGEFVTWVIGHGEFAANFNIVGFIDDDLRKHDLVISERPVLGLTNDLPVLVKKYDIGIVIYAISNISPIEQDRILTLCHQTNVKIVLFPNIIGMIRASLSPEFSPDPKSNHETESGVLPVSKEDLPQVIAELDLLLDNGDVIAAHNRLHELRDVLENA
jgi:lipopolysaccharide/colanic/teichoic acid biosynthesis glycosyltransferase